MPIAVLADTAQHTRYRFLGADILKPNLTAIAKHLQTSQKTGGSTTREYVLDPAKSPEPTPPAPAKPTFVPKALRPRRPGRGGFLNSWRK